MIQTLESRKAERLRSLKETTETGQQNALCDPGPEPREGK